MKHGKMLGTTSKNNKVRKKSDPSKWTSHKRTKGAFESEKMMCFTNRDDKHNWNDFCDLHDKLEHKIKLPIPTSSLKPKT